MSRGFAIHDANPTSWVVDGITLFELDNGPVVGVLLSSMVMTHVCCRLYVCLWFRATTLNLFKVDSGFGATTPNLVKVDLVVV